MASSLPRDTLKFQRNRVYQSGCADDDMLGIGILWHRWPLNERGTPSWPIRIIVGDSYPKRVHQQHIAASQRWMRNIAIQWRLHLGKLRRTLLDGVAIVLACRAHLTEEPICG